MDLDLICIEIGVKKTTRNELARPVMGTIFLVNGNAVLNLWIVPTVGCSAS